MNFKSKKVAHNIVLLFSGILGCLSLILPALDESTWFGNIQIWFFGFNKGLTDDFLSDLFLTGLGILLITAISILLAIKGFQKKISRKMVNLLPIIEIIAGVGLIICAAFFDSLANDHIWGSINTGAGLICCYLNITLLLITGIVILIIDQTQ
ncbi:hypothetical protein NEF87_003433 [Candidatus Lokiarchaeum ossiferum]|uniref:DUF998 domain-containing protein n=1 Tax=Candidatus Lokiarchaeum ossiferum TaxID=2951803 RepID=A0ABY6HUX5_9ARCH|nr:hypothetical protein NEF87_003433 [Candidatus Lokiarchaeum sp. B-35]